MASRSNVYLIGAVMDRGRMTKQLTMETFTFVKKPQFPERISWGQEEEEEMEEKKKCPLFRQPEGLSFGKGVGYCDIDNDSTTCEGDVKSCEKPDALKQYLRRKLNDFEKDENKGK